MSTTVTRRPNLARRLIGAGFAALLLGAACETPRAPVEATPAPAPAPQPAPEPAPPRASPNGGGASQAEREALFRTWLTSFGQRAAAAGRKPEVISAVLDGLTPLEERLQPARDQQAEFVKPIWDYARSAVSETRVANGRTKLQENAGVFSKIEAAYAPPRAVLTAIWGMESAYGYNIGNIDAARALATQAAMGRRVDFNEGELIAIMKLIEEGHTTRDQFRKASWAGALGQTQFMPSSFLQYGRDFDGDGMMDIWSNAGDALATAANYLTAYGWRTGEPPMIEVALPEGFDVSLSDGRKMSVGDWLARGLQPAPGLSLSDPALAAELFMPAGTHGPSFLLFHNFGVIKRYNNADSYALGISLLAQRLGGGPDLHKPWPTSMPMLTLDEAKELQGALNALGYSAGTVDGIIGRGTRAAVQRFQKDRDITPDGFPTREVFGLIKAAAAR